MLECISIPNGGTPCRRPWEGPIHAETPFPVPPPATLDLIRQKRTVQVHHCQMSECKPLWLVSPYGKTAGALRHSLRTRP